MGFPVEKRRYTISEYLRFERESPEKHEYWNGEIVAMAGGSYNHSLISMNFGGEMRNSLKGKGCHVLESNLRVRTPRTPLYTYPDISVVCGEPQFDANDPTLQTVTNPLLVVEVLSPSTEAHDRGEKFTRYRIMDSFREYVLVSQHTPRVEMFFRQPEGTWLFTAVSGLESRAKLMSISIEIPLAEIYAGVTFEPDPAIPDSPAI